MNFAGDRARDRKLVRVIYIDEAGSSTTEPVFTWASVIIKDSVWLNFEADAENIVTTLVPEVLRSDFEFHACEIFGGNDRWFPWRNRCGKELRFEILRHFVSLISKYELPIMECSWRKPSNATTDKREAKIIQGISFSLCIEFVERWFAENAQSDVGMLITDTQGDRRDEALYKTEIRRARKISRLNGILQPLNHIVDTIHFAGSHESIGLQIADACAFFIKRHHNSPADDEITRVFEMFQPFIHHSTIIESRGRIEARKIASPS